AVISHQDATNLPDLRAFSFDGGTANQSILPLRDKVIRHFGQTVAVVVAETLEQALHAARLIELDYAPQPPRADLDSRLVEAYLPELLFGIIPPEYKRGDPRRGLAEAAIRVEERYTTPIEHHNPMEPHAAIAVWDGDDNLTVYDSSQGVVATQLGLAE